MKKIYENKKIILIIGGIIVLILFLVLFLINDKEIEGDIVLNVTTEKIAITKESESFYVDVKGNVKNPGVYEVTDGEVINDVIERAGGLKKNSYIKNINLSKKVTDEMVIYILSIDEYEDLTFECPICVCEEVKCDEINMTISTTPTTTMVSKTTTNTTLTTQTTKIETTTITKKQEDINKLININTATKEELMSLSGIGETIANRIIGYRESNSFLTINDIKKVKGIGDTLFEKIKESITV